MLRLGTYALREACAPCTGPVPLLLAVPEERPGSAVAADLARPGFFEALAAQAQVQVQLDAQSSRLYPQGGAGGLIALRDALALLSSQRFPSVLVGGVDTFLDLLRLGVLDGESRLAGGGGDGFIPGEGAAFLLLSNQRHRGLPPPIARVAGVGVGVERGHRYAQEPYRGDGLDEAFQALFAGRPRGAAKVQCVYAGFNGENLPAKEWGVAYLRSAEHFAEGFGVEHPADCVGDAGAALGPMMLGLAALGMRHGYRSGPCLVWSTSDREARAAALLETA
jgi:3-oxoacyl-[acyl-carrier-protein] synthase-1